MWLTLAEQQNSLVDQEEPVCNHAFSALLLAIWGPNISSRNKGTKYTPSRNSFHFREKKVSPCSECRWKMCSSTLIPKLSGSRWRSLTLKIILWTAGAIPWGEVNNPMQWHLRLSPALQNYLSPGNLKSHPPGVPSSPFLPLLSVTATLNRKHTFFHVTLYLM